MTLRVLTGKGFGFAAYEAADKREAAIEKWKSWIAGEGKQAKLRLPLKPYEDNRRTFEALRGLQNNRGGRGGPSGIPGGGGFPGGRGGIPGGGHRCQYWPSPKRPQNLSSGGPPAFSFGLMAAPPRLTCGIYRQIEEHGDHSARFQPPVKWRSYVEREYPESSAQFLLKALPRYRDTVQQNDTSIGTVKVAEIIAEIKREVPGWEEACDKELLAEYEEDVAKAQAKLIESNGHNVVDVQATNHAGNGAE